MKDLIITIDYDTRNVKFNRDFIGLNGENMQGNIVVDFEDKKDFIDGTAYFEVEQNGNKYFIEMTKNAESNTFYIPIKASLLRYTCTLKCQISIREDNAGGEEIPVFKSVVFNIPCNESVNAVEGISGDYPFPTWKNEVSQDLNDLKTKTGVVNLNQALNVTIGGTTESNGSALSPAVSPANAVGTLVRSTNGFIGQIIATSGSSVTIQTLIDLTEEGASTGNSILFTDLNLAEEIGGEITALQSEFEPATPKKFDCVIGANGYMGQITNDAEPYVVKTKLKLKGEDAKPTYYDLPIPANKWTEDSTKETFTHRAVIAVNLPITDNSVVELINNNPSKFMEHAFSIFEDGVTGASITIYSIGSPSEDLTLKVGVVK